MGEKRRPERSDESRSARVGEREDGDALRLAPEGRPQARSRTVDPEVAAGPADRDAADHAATPHFHDHDLLPLRVRDVREPRVGGDGRVARRGELTMDLVHAEVGVDQRQPAAGGVGDERADHADAFDAARIGGSVEPPVHLPAAEVDGDDARLQVGSHERERRSAAAPRECGRRQAEHERCCRHGEEVAPIHALSTSGPAAQVPGPHAAPPP